MRTEYHVIAEKYGFEILVARFEQKPHAEKFLLNPKWKEKGLTPRIREVKRT